MKNPWYFAPRTKVNESIKQYKLFTLENCDLKRFLNHNFSVVQMNSTFIEFINKEYIWIGKSFIYSLIMGIPVLVMSIFFIYLIFFDYGEIDYIMWFGALSIFIASLYILITMLQPLIRNELLKPLYNSIILNRKNKEITFSKSNEILQLKLSDLYFDIVQSQGVAGLPLYELHAYVLDGERIKHDIQLGTPNIHKDHIEGFLLFIKTYVEQGPEPLYYRKGIDDPEQEILSKLTYCYDIQEKKEPFSQSWQTVFINHFKTPLFAIFFAIPEFFRFFGRRITVLFSKPFYWSEQLKKDNSVDENDPYIVTAKDNLKFGFFSVKDK